MARVNEKMGGGGVGVTVDKRLLNLTINRNLRLNLNIFGAKFY